MRSSILQSFICVCLVVAGVAAQSATDGKQQTKEVRAHYEAAQAFERAGDWSSAEREWQAVLKLA